MTLKVICGSQKFPSRNDQRDIGAWEMVINELANEAGIHMSEARLERYASKQHTYMAKRFDRTSEGRRIHFASAMTLLGYHDFEEGISYLELAEFVAKNSAKPDQDLEELWRRIMFSIYVSNTDDHLRNHGFLLTKEGWRLSPAYDINPIEGGNGLKLNITEEDNALEPTLAMQTISFYRLSNEKAEEIHQRIRRSVGNWRNVASKYHISKADQELMSASFKS